MLAHQQQHLTADACRVLLLLPHHASVSLPAPHLLLLVLFLGRGSAQHLQESKSAVIRAAAAAVVVVVVLVPAAVSLLRHYMHALSTSRQ